MRQAIELVGIANLVLFAVIAVVCVRQWRRERAVTALWAATAFVALSCVILVGEFLPEDPMSLAAKVVQRLDLAILVLFPYLLYRFASAFERMQPSARTLCRCDERHARDGDAAAPVRAHRGGDMAVLVRRLRRRIPRPLVGAADHRRDPPLARRASGGIGGAKADADARVRRDGADRRARLLAGGR